MNFKEIIQESYSTYLSINNLVVDNTDNKFRWLSDVLFNVTTYDENLDLEFGKMIHEVMVNIYNKTTFEYIEKSENYRPYILVCNLLKGLSMIEWGTSIRGGWFDYSSNPKFDGILTKDSLIITEDVIKYLLFEFIKNGKDKI
jgi:hypothetical protein